MNSLVRIGSIATALGALLVPSIASAHPSYRGHWGAHYAAPRYVGPRYVAPRPYYAPHVYVAPHAWGGGQRWHTGWRR